MASANGVAITGIGKRLKEHNPHIQVIKVIPEGPPWVGRTQTLGEPRRHHSGHPPMNVIIDARVDVAAEDAYEMYWRKLAREGFFNGQSSGG